MKKLLLTTPLAAFALFACMALGADQPQPVRPELLQVKNVYMMPMHFGLDQYLANELVRTGAVRVVIDPAKADAVFTDRLGDALEQRLNAMYPTPAKEEPKPATDEKKPADAAANAATTPESAPDAATKPIIAKPLKKGAAPDSAYMSIFEADPNSRAQGSFSSGRGNVFLIDRYTRAVIWSYYEAPRSAQPADLKRSADRVAEAFKHAVQPKAEHQ